MSLSKDLRARDGVFEMQGIADLLITAFWKILSKQDRELISKKILALQVRAFNCVQPSSVEVYPFSKDTSRLFKRYLAVDFDPNDAFRLKLPDYSLVTTCRNEEDNITQLLDSVVRQTFLPKEFIICDGGSSDNTVSLINQWNLRREPSSEFFTLKVIESGPISIAEGRNRAVKDAQCEIILFTDAGGSLDRFWAERLLTPFAFNPATEVSMGWYRPLIKDSFQEAAAQFLIPQLDSLDPAYFLPSGRSLALRRSVYWLVGGYPEHLSFAGEDSLFDYYLKGVARNFAFVPDAFTYWRFPEGWNNFAKTVFRYSKGDAEGGVLFWDYYLRLLKSYGKISVELALLVLLLLLYSSTGFTVLKVAATIVFLSVFLRFLLQVLAYKPFSGIQFNFSTYLNRFFAVSLMSLSQVCGFVAGLKSRKGCELRRISKGKKGIAVLLLSDAPIFNPSSEDIMLCLRLLEESWYLTILYRQSALENDSSVILFEHPQIEIHLRTQFDLDCWLKKFKPILGKEGREFKVFDRCQDSLSHELTAKLVAKGATISL